MSILIKGMDMPMDCTVCPIDCDLWLGTPEEGKPQDCPLVEVTTPHGRLIDADDIKTITVACTERGCVKRIDAPIVIESEE